MGPNSEIESLDRLANQYSDQAETHFEAVFERFLDRTCGKQCNDKVESYQEFSTKANQYHVTKFAKVAKFYSAERNFQFSNNKFKTARLASVSKACAAILNLISFAEFIQDNKLHENDYHVIYKEILKAIEDKLVPCTQYNKEKQKRSRHLWH